MKIQIKEIHASSIITKSNLPDADYVINPYTGCTHACLYCYARFMKRFTGHPEEWGKFVDVKINAPELIPLNSDKFRGKSIFLASVTDAYLSLEKKYRLTRGVLEKLIPLQPKLSIQTKSDLIVRDIDLLRQFDQCEAGLTITTLDDVLRKEIEPYTSSVQNRIGALRQLKDGGIYSYVFIGPILPFLTDWKEIIRKTKSFVDCYMFENLNTAGTVGAVVKKWIGKKHPDLKEAYDQIFFSGRAAKDRYWNPVEEEIAQFCRDEKVDFKIYFHHGREKKRNKG